MLRPSPLIWLAILLLFLLPTAAGRVLLDIAGGLMLASLAIPIVLAGFGWLAWRGLQSKMVTCEVCGIKTFQNNGDCPVCGSAISSKNSSASSTNQQNNNSVSASNATIDVQAEDIGSDS